MLVNANGLPITPAPPAATSSAESSTGALAADALSTAVQYTNASYISDGDEHNFMTSVVDTSMHTPVLVDFWAPWCEPCKQYTPILEQAIVEEHGQVRLVKVNIDDNPNLAQQLQIRSLPTTMVFLQGRPLEPIPGVLDKATLRKLFSQILKMVGKVSHAEQIAGLLAEAEQLLGDNPAEALERFLNVIAAHPDHTAAIAGALRAFIATERLVEAEELYIGLEEHLKQHTDILEAYRGVALAGGAQDNEALQEAQAAHEQNPDDLSARFSLAELLIGAGQHEQAINQLLAILSKDRTWQDKKAHLCLLDLFATLGFQHPLSKQGRQKLANILFQ